MDYTGNDFYCDVAIPRKVPLEVCFENDRILAFHHTRPHWPRHIVVVPKQHISSFLALTEEHNELLFEMLGLIQLLATNVVCELGGARIITNLGTYQDSKHLHFHVCAGDPIK